MTASPDVKYLRHVLQLNPCESSREILNARRIFRNPAEEARIIAVDEESREARTRRRTRLENRIDDVRQRFWDCEPDQIQAGLAEFETDDFPELTLEIERLLAVAKLRSSFEQLKRHRECFPNFTRFFRRLVVESPGNAARLRAAPPTWGFRQGKRLASTIQSEFPDLFALEPDWINRMQQRRERRRLLITEEMVNVVVGWVILLALAAVIAWLASG